VTSVWYVITALGVLAAIINFTIGGIRRKEPYVVLARAGAGLVSLLAAVGIVVGKEVVHYHPGFQWQWQTAIIATGVFVFIVLFLPSLVGRDEKAQKSLQARAARPANATVRLGERGADEWVN